jgi:hypothetical protein
MNMVKAMKPLPTNVEHIINRINALRNVVASQPLPGKPPQAYACEEIAL